MSSLSNSPCVETISYWLKHPVVKCNRCRFLATKMLEMFCYKLFANSKVVSLCPNTARPIVAPQENWIDEDSSVAIVVPVFVRDSEGVVRLGRCVRALREQTVKSSIILVDDCSREHFQFDGVEIVRIENNCGPAHARNIGMRKALEIGANIIAFTDSDCLPNANWVERIKDAFIKDKYVHILSGRTISYGETWFDRYHDMNGTLNGRQYKNDARMLYGVTANLAVIAGVAMACEFDEGFKTAAGEDIEFCVRAQKLGYSISFAKTAIVQHDYGYQRWFWRNLRQFASQFIRYARSEKRLLSLQPDYFSLFEMTREISNERIKP